MTASHSCCCCCCTSPLQGCIINDVEQISVKHIATTRRSDPLCRSSNSEEDDDEEEDFFLFHDDDDDVQVIFLFSVTIDIVLFFALLVAGFPSLRMVNDCCDEEKWVRREANALENVLGALAALFRFGQIRYYFRGRGPKIPGDEY